MPIVYLRKKLYDEIVKRGHDVTDFVNKAVEETLKKEEKDHEKNR